MSMRGHFRHAWNIWLRRRVRPEHALALHCSSAIMVWAARARPAAPASRREAADLRPLVEDLDAGTLAVVGHAKRKSRGAALGSDRRGGALSRCSPPAVPPCQRAARRRAPRTTPTMNATAIQPIWPKKGGTGRPLARGWNNLLIVSTPPAFILDFSIFVKALRADVRFLNFCACQVP